MSDLYVKITKEGQLHGTTARVVGASGSKLEIEFGSSYRTIVDATDVAVIKDRS